MPQVGSQVLKFRHLLFYFRRVGETGSDAPPDPGHAARRRQLTRQLRDHRRIFVIIDHISHACVAHAPGAKPIAVKHLEQFDSQRCQSSVLVQKRIGKLAMRKYKLANSVNRSL